MAFRKKSATKGADSKASATFMNEVLKVDGVSNKYGNGAILVGKEWINLNDGVESGELTKGETYEFEIKVGTNGKRYVNKIVSLQDAETAPAPEADDVEPVKASAPRKAAAKTGKEAGFRSPDEIERSSAIGIAGGSELYKKLLEDVTDTDEAKSVLTDVADFVLAYIENGSVN